MYVTNYSPSQKKKTHQDELHSIMVHVIQNHVQLTESFPHDVHYSSFIKRYAMSLICLLFLFFFLQWHCTWITRSLQLWAGIKRVSTVLFVSRFALFFFLILWSHRNQGNFIPLLVNPNLTRERVISSVLIPTGDAKPKYLISVHVFIVCLQSYIPCHKLYPMSQGVDNLTIELAIDFAS